MNESLGTRLRHRREQKNIDLVAIAERTKIKLSLLEALERDDASQWPNGIFRRAFVRAYAEAIGANADAVVREFLEIHPDPQEIAPTAAEDANAGEGGRQPRIRQIVGSALGSFSLRRRTPPVVQPPTPDPSRMEPEATVRVERVETTVLVEAVEPISEPHDPIPLPPEMPEPVVEDRDPDFLAVARLCTELGRVETMRDMERLLPEAARILNASGLIVWIWDGIAAALKPALVHGYPARIVANLPPVPSDAENPTAAAFRNGQPVVVDGTASANGALVVPLLGPGACAGVLAIELERGTQMTSGTRAVSTILAALLAQLFGGTGAEVPQSSAII